MKWTALALVAGLTGCVSHGQPPAAQPAGGPPARLDVARALAHHPFAPVLAQYDRDIATLRHAEGAVAFADTHRQIEAGSTGIDRRLAAAAAALSHLRREPILPPESMVAGRNSPSEFGNGTLEEYREAVSARMVRAHQLRAAQLHEHEQNVAFAFERAHAGRRLVLKLKLHELHLDGDTRTRYRAELDALAAREAAQVEAARARDAATLAAYDAQLAARSAADVRDLSAEVAAHASAMQTLARPVRSLPASILNAGDGSDVSPTFTQARSDVSARFGQVRAMDDAARSAARNEIAALTAERAGLRSRMVAAIEARARNIANSRHLGTVYATHAPPNAHDITDAVIRALQ